VFEEAVASYDQAIALKPPQEPTADSGHMETYPECLK
jgi:hypothetical protein